MGVANAAFFLSSTRFLHSVESVAKVTKTWDNVAEDMSVLGTTCVDKKLTSSHQGLDQ